MLRGMLGPTSWGSRAASGRELPPVGRELEDVHVDIRAHRADLDGREVQVRSFPVAVGAFEIREASQTDRAKRLRTRSRRSEAIGVCSSASTGSSRRRTSCGDSSRSSCSSRSTPRARRGRSSRCSACPARRSPRTATTEPIAADGGPDQRRVRQGGLDADRREGPGGLRRTPSPPTTATTRWS